MADIQIKKNLELSTENSIRACQLQKKLGFALQNLRILGHSSLSNNLRLDLMGEKCLCVSPHASLLALVVDFKDLSRGAVGK